MFLAEAFSYGLIGVAVFEGVSIFFNIALASPGSTPPGWLTAMGTLQRFSSAVSFLSGFSP
jgi:hypothetical protein